MKNNYFFKSFQNTVVLLILFFGINMSAQSFLVTFPDNTSAPIQNPRNVAICDATSNSLLRVQLDAINSSTTGATVGVLLSPGVNYVPGSLVLDVAASSPGVSFTSEVITNLNNPVFKFGPNTMAVSTRIVFTIARTATCASATNITLADTVTASVSGRTASTGTSNTYLLNPIPNFSFQQPASQTNAVLNTTYNRDFVINNGGLGGASSVYFSITYPNNAIAQTSVTLLGNATANDFSPTLSSGTNGAASIVLTPTSVTTVPAGNTYYYTISAAQLSSGLFDFGEKLIIRETYKIKACGATSNYSVGWGCSPLPSLWCQTINGTAAVAMANGVPNYSNFTTTNLDFVNMCTPWNVRLRMTNTGSTTGNESAMYNVLAKWGMDHFNTRTNGYNSNPGTGYSITNIRVGTATAIVTLTGPVGDQTINIDMSQFTTDPDGDGFGLEDVDGDGFFDDLPSGKDLDILYTYQFIDNTSCSVGGMDYSGPVMQIDYNTMCGTRINPNPKKAGNYYGQYGASNATVYPPQVQGGTNFNITFDAGLGSYSIPNDFNRMLYKWEITMPTGVNLVPGSAQYFNGTSWVPLLTPPSIVGQLVTFTSPFSYTLRAIRANFNYTCGTAASLVFNQKLIRISDTDTNCIMRGNLLCNSFTIQALCPSPCAAGPTAFQPVVSRAANSLGYTDYTMTTRKTAGSLTADQLKRALYLHEITVTGRAVQNNAASNMHLELELDKSDPAYGAVTDKLTPIDAVVTVTRAGVVTTTTLTTFTSGTTASTTHTAMDINLTPAFPGGSILAGDDVTVVARYKVATNNLKLVPELPANSKWRFYNYNVSGGKDFCLDWIPEMYLLGTNTFSTFNQSTMQASGCSSVLTLFIDSRKYGGSTDLFPNEIIPIFNYNSFTAKIPAGYEFDYAVYGVARGGVWGPAPLTVTPTSVTSDTVTFTNNGSWTPVFLTHSVRYDQVQIGVYFKPTCQTAPYFLETTSTTNISIKDFYYAYNTVPPALPTTTTYDRTYLYPSGSKAYNYNPASRPTITLTNQIGSVQATKPTESFVVRMNSTGTTTAPYTWLSIPTVAGISITEVRDVATNTIVPTTAYSGGLWAAISAAGLTSGTSKDYKISFTYTICTPATINVQGGWDCNGFPSNPDSYPCGKSDVNVPFQIFPQAAAVQIIAISEPSSAITLCTPLMYQYNVNSAGAGNAVDNEFTINYPAGLSLVAGSFQAEYPVGSGNWQAISPVTSGLSSTINLTTHTNYPSAGLPGTLTDGGNANSRLIAVRFELISGCDFVSGTNVKVSTKANRSCGQPANGSDIEAATLSVNVSGVDASYIISANISSNSLASSITKLNIDQLLTTSSPIGSTASSVITLPLGFTYVPGSLVCTSVLCPTLVGTSTNGAGQEMLTLSLPAGMSSGNHLVYSINIVAASEVPCDDYNVSLKSFDQIVGLSCPTLPSPSLCGAVTFQTEEDQYVFSLIKPTLEISQFSHSNAVPACNGSAAIPASTTITLTNTGLVDQTTPVIIPITGAGTLSFTGPILAGTSVTQIFSSIPVLTAVSSAELVDSVNNLCNSDKRAVDLFPIATCDSGTMLMNTPVTVNVISNDVTGDAVVPSTVSLVIPSGATGIVTDGTGDITSMTIPGEGTWTVNPTTGAITFTPISGFTGTPSPIQYNVEDAERNQSNNATLVLTVRYPVTIGDVTVNEGDGTASVPVTLGGPSSVDTVIDITTTTGTAGTSDYTATTIQVTIPAGQTTVNVVIPITDDLIDEPNEKFTVNGTLVSGTIDAANSDFIGEVTIVDNDAPEIILVTESGSFTAAVGGVLPDVTLNDTINGLPIDITPTGNMILSASGVWPIGITLNTLTGVIDVAPGIAPGIYAVEYTLCDKLTPQSCASMVDQITITAAVNPVKEDYVIPSTGGVTPNIASNDMVNGYPADISPTGNATIAPSGIWPTGIVLDPTSGVITVASGTVPGIYTLEYTLCDKLTPQACSKVSNVIQVTPVINPVKEDFTLPSTGGSTTSIVLNDTVNGLPANISPSGNAVIAAVGTWPTGITLNPLTGIISAQSGAIPGVYAVEYTLCDKLTPQSCATMINEITIEFVAAPSISLVKSANFNNENGDAYAQPGETITYNFVITNTGNVPLTNVIVTDLLPRLIVNGSPIPLLGVGQTDTTTYSAIYTITKADVISGTLTNDAMVSGADQNGNAASNTASVSTDLKDDGIVIVHNAVSPNDDGKNDFLRIEGIELYPDNTVEIYNRWGVLVYERKGYNNVDRTFKGMSEGRVTVNQSEQLPVGTYYYVLKYIDDKGVGHEKAGYLYINR